MDDEQPKTYSSNERMTVGISDRTFVCVEYPGIVQNVDKALETLGGIKAVRKSAADPKHRLELRFRPNDLYCKPAGSNHSNTFGLIMKVRRRKKQPSAITECNSYDDGYEYQAEVLGRVTTVLSFPGMCDFQYLPMVRKRETEYEGFLHKLQFDPTQSSREEFLSRDVPLFLPPLGSTRFEFPMYGYMSERPPENLAGTDMPGNLLGTGRKSRMKHHQALNFTDPAPTGPLPGAVELAKKYSDSGLKEELLTLFEERPIWSLNALRYRLRHNHSSRNQVLIRVVTCIAYFFHSGPWRMMYVRYGYDPRQDPTSKKYQCVDFRCRTQYEISRKRKDLFNSSQRRKFDPKVDLSVLRDDDDDNPSNSEPKITDYEFHPDVLPTQRQIFYMACDIYDPEVTELLSRNDGKEPEVCDEKNGWCIPNFTDLCRTIMKRHVQRLTPATMVTTYMRKKKRYWDKMMADSKQQAEEDNDDDDVDSDDLEFDLEYS